MPRDVTYSSYLDLDRILSAQHPASAAHDELLFIIVHQASELWLKLCLHELNAARAEIAADDLRPAFKMLARVARAQNQLISSWDVLSTMTPADYSEVRPHLASSSGFQSAQYRMIEICATDFINLVDKDKRAEFLAKDAPIGEMYNFIYWNKYSK